MLYVTVSTGIGAGLVVDGRIDQAFAGSEAGQLMLAHHDALVPWESFASGSAIVRRYGKMAKDIDPDDHATWKAIARDISLGLIELIAMTQPDIIVIGGSIGVHFARYGDFLRQELKKYHNPLVPIPPIKAAERPDDAVVYGCYDLARITFGQDHAATSAQPHGGAEPRSTGQPHAAGQTSGSRRPHQSSRPHHGAAAS